MVFFFCRRRATGQETPPPSPPRSGRRAFGEVVVVIHDDDPSHDGGLGWGCLVSIRPGAVRRGYSTGAATPCRCTPASVGRVAPRRGAYRDQRAGPLRGLGCGVLIPDSVYSHCRDGPLVRLQNAFSMKMALPEPLPHPLPEQGREPPGEVVVDDPDDVPSLDGALPPLPPFGGRGGLGWG